MSIRHLSLLPLVIALGCSSSSSTPSEEPDATPKVDAKASSASDAKEDSPADAEKDAKPDAKKADDAGSALMYSCVAGSGGSNETCQAFDFATSNATIQADEAKAKANCASAKGTFANTGCPTSGLVGCCVMQSGESSFCDCSYGTAVTQSTIEATCKTMKATFATTCPF
jgi:hypothetical protein